MKDFDPEMQMAFRAAIKRIRKAKKLTQEELGEMVGRPQSWVSKLERGGVGLSLDTFVTLCERLDVSSERLLRDIRTQRGHASGGAGAYAVDSRERARSRAAESKPGRKARPSKKKPKR